MSMKANTRYRKTETVSESKPKISIFGRGNTSKKAKHHPYLAFDIEDDSQGNFLIGVIYGEKYTKHQTRTEKRGKLRHFEHVYLGEKGYYEMCDFINNLTPGEAYLIGFNTGYDLGILDADIKVEYLFAKGRFIQAKTARKSLIRDLSNHFDKGTSLEDLLPMAGMKKDHPTDEEDKERRAGIINQAWIDRCYSDAKGTWLLTAKLEDFYTENQAVFKPTIGSTGLDMFRRRFFHHFWFRSEKQQYLNEYERKAYFGGRTEGYIKGVNKVWSYDVNSMYVSVMNDNVFPDPNSAKWHGRSKSSVKILKGYIYGKEKKQGIAHVKINIPGMKYPPLPYRAKIKGEDKLIFPTGTIEGWWTFAELELALSVKCEIKEVYRFVHYERSFPYFKEFAQWVWNERKKHPKDKEPFWNLMVKLMGNSLSGKWGQENEIGGVYVLKEDYDLWVTKNPKLDAKIEYEEDLGTHWLLRTNETVKENARHSFPILIAYITSYARIKLYKEMVKHVTVYVDTDSIKYIGLKREIEHSKELGAWGFEPDKSGLFEFFAPKFYRTNGVLKIKGTPQKVCTGKRGKIEETETAIIAYFDKPNKWREAKRSMKPAINIDTGEKEYKGKKIGLWHEICKTSEKRDTKRIWNKDGSSKAINMQDIEREQENEQEIKEEKKRDIAYQKEQRQIRVNTRKFIKKTDKMDVDSMLNREEQIEDAVNEQKRWCN